MTNSMNIAYIADGRMPTKKAYGYQIAKMCEQFGLLGHKVTLWIPKRKSSIKQSVHEFYGVKDNFVVKEVESQDMTGTMLDRFAISYYIRQLSFLFSLRKRLKDSTQLLYTRDVMIARFFSKKHVVYLELHSIPKRFQKLFIKFVKSAKKIIVISGGLNNELVELGVEKENVYVAPDGVTVSEFDIDISKEEARKELDIGVADGKKVIVYIGSLYTWKGVHTLCEVAKELVEEIDLHIIGGPDTQEHTLRSEYPDENIYVHGYKPHEIVPLYAKAADVVVVPNSKKTKISREFTSPLKLFEYMAAKRPIIVSDLPSMREIVDESQVYFFEPDVVDELMRSVRTVLNEDCSKKIQSAFDKVQQYDWGMRARGILKSLE